MLSGGVLGAPTVAVERLVSGKLDAAGRALAEAFLAVGGTAV